MSEPATSTQPPQPASPGETLMEVRDLVKHFPIRKGLLQRQVGAVRAVDGVSFDVLRGETLGLVGESGCGKSTTARLLLRLMEPTSGSIRFEGEEIADIRSGRLKELRREMQMIFQDPYSSLNPRKTVGSIIGEPFIIHGIEKTEAADRAALEDDVTFGGLEQADDAAAERRLSAAGLADEAERLSGLHVERHVVDGVHPRDFA